MTFNEAHISRHDNNDTVKAWLGALLPLTNTNHSTQVITPPASDNGLKRARSVKNMEPPQSTKKRKRHASRNAPPILDLENTPSLVSVSVSSRNLRSPKSPSSNASSPSRSPSPSKDLLNLLRRAAPPVDCQEPGVAMPAKALELRTLLSKDFGEGVIPMRLKVSLHERTGFATPC